MLMCTPCLVWGVLQAGLMDLSFWSWGLCFFRQSEQFVTTLHINSCEMYTGLSSIFKSLSCPYELCDIKHSLPLSVLPSNRPKINSYHAKSWDYGFWASPLGDTGSAYVVRYLYTQTTWMAVPVPTSPRSAGPVWESSLLLFSECLSSMSLPLKSKSSYLPFPRWFLAWCILICILFLPRP